jgi:LCP family protein required for cell wall assembly
MTDRPPYRVHRAGGAVRPRPATPAGARDDRPPYRVHRTRPRLLAPRDEPELGELLRGEPPPREGRRVRPRRVVGVLALALVAWLGLSLVLFLVSAQVQESKVSPAAERALHPAGFPLVSASTTLVLGSDARTRRTAEPGSRVGGRGRSDTIMLIRSGPGRSARLSIPRDTLVDIPGHGRMKINAAYALGGPALAIRTVEQYLGIEVNHLVEVNFANFPRLIDALGGIDYTGPPLLSKINGGRENGGFTLRLHRGTNHLNGRQALALARTRKNLLDPSENDLDRARRQQRILSAMKDQLLSPSTFFRLPWVSWAAPQAIRSDMAGPSLLGMVGTMATTSSPPPRLLEPSAFVTLSDGEQALTVSEAEKRAEVRRFLKG